MSELWLPIPGFEGYYDASSLGRIRSLPRQTRTGVHGGQILKPVSGKYLTVKLSKDNVKRTFTIHVLVCLAFHEKPGPEYEVRHKDGDSHNNRADNLVWGTSSDNAHDTVDHGHHHYASRTHCSNDHEYTDATTRWRTDSKGRRSRVCRVCERDRGKTLTLVA